MIYISSSCVKHASIKNIIELFVAHEIYNIELSGGTKYYDGLIDDIYSLKEKYNLNLLVHNYFPPPKEDFVLNLASLDNEIWDKSIIFFEKSIQLAIDLGSPSYGLHAGFFFDPSTREIGKKISKTNLYNKELAIQHFIQGYTRLKNKFDKKIKLCIENHVVSYENLQTFSENPFMLTSYNDYLELQKQLDFNLLLDIGHLQVSSNSLNLDFDNECNNLIKVSNYIHISDNDGKKDLHQLPNHKSKIYSIAKNLDFESKVVSLEIGDNIESIKKFCKELNNERPR